MRLSTLSATLLLALASASASAAPDIKSRLTTYEQEAATLASSLKTPDSVAQETTQRRLVDAEVAVQIGNYDKASLILFDLVGHTQGADHEAALYYLGESLYQKGDKGAARAYFQELVSAGSSGGHYYQPSLARLVEIAIAENDPAAAEQAVSSLNGINASLRTALVPYIQGKWAFSQGKYDDAIALFNSVPKGSDYELQAQYYTATAYVAKQDLAKATDTYTDLIGKVPRSNTDRRVVELAQLALGRLYYEREQLSKSIDSYVMVDRHSDLFPTALYEVGWVYVKNKQFDKALTALELLGRLDPQSTLAPTVKILEGNLRIRKAQMIRNAEVTGTIGTEEKSTPEQEYAKAETIFTATHDAYYPSYLTLSHLAEGQVDAASFIDQITGRNDRVFAASTPLPEAAAKWLREEPEVQRVVSIETDLGDVQKNLDEARSVIERLEGVLATGDQLSLYPALLARRLQIAAIQHDLIGIRNQLADQAIAGGASSSGTSQRKALAAQYAALGNPEAAHAERTSQAQREYYKASQDSAETKKVVTDAQAMAVAVRTYADSGKMPDEQRTSVTSEIDAATKEAQAIEDELADVDREIVVGKDLAAVGDKDWIAARALRDQLIAAQNTEQLGFGGRGGPLADQAMRLAQQLSQTDAQIDALVAKGVEDVKAQLANERQLITEYTAELAEHEGESHTVGAELLTASFKSVRDKIYDIVIRADVGNVDVAWSHKEDNDDDLKRLGLAKSRDLKQLHDEFKFVLDEETPSPAQPKAPAAPTTQEGTTGTSPDQGAGTSDRVKPAEGTTGSAQPTVKPDSKTAPKAAPKTGGSK